MPVPAFAREEKTLHAERSFQFYEQGFIDLARGMDQESAPTSQAPGTYAFAQNMILGVDGGKKYLASMKLESKLDPLIVWPPGNVLWFGPFTYSTYSGGVLTFFSHVIIARDTGAVWRWDAPAVAGNPGTSTLVRRGFNTFQDWHHLVYDKFLITMNQRDAPMKYGQHFNIAAQGEVTPYLFPLGSKPVSPLGPAITSESWVMTGAGTGFTADASGLVPAGGSRVGTQSLKIVAGAGNKATNTWTNALDFNAGPFPYGTTAGAAFAGTDSLIFQYYKTATLGNIRVRFGDTGDLNFFEFTLTQANQQVGGWKTANILRSAAVTTGTPNWNSIAKLTIFTDDATNDLWVDDLYFLYANAPPAFAVGTQHKDRVVGGGVPVVTGSSEAKLGNIFWSKAQLPDEFPGTNVQVLTAGGAAGLARANQINAMREYGDTIIVGLTNGVISWTIDSAGNPAKTTVTTDWGIDSHSGIVETPSGSLVFPWQRGFYLLRATGRSYISGRIADQLTGMFLAGTLGGQTSVGAIDEQTKTLRFWYRTGTTDPGNTTAGIIFDYARAQEEGIPVWVGTSTQLADYATPLYINGFRVTAYSRFNDPNVWLLHQTASGVLTSFVRLPWMGRESKDTLTKWVACVIPYQSTQDITVSVATASNPGEFDTATFTTVETLPASPTAVTQAIVPIGLTSRWAQIRILVSNYGMRVYPPITVFGLPTQRRP